MTGDIASIKSQGVGVSTSSHQKGRISPRLIFLIIGKEKRKFI